MIKTGCFFIYLVFALHRCKIKTSRTSLQTFLNRNNRAEKSILILRMSNPEAIARYANSTTIREHRILYYPQHFKNNNSGIFQFIQILEYKIRVNIIELYHK